MKSFKKNEIALVICSNRLEEPLKIFNGFSGIKIVFVSQIKNNAQKRNLSKNFEILYDNKSGVSNAKNLAISCLLKDKKTKLIIFTDDDCIPTNNWIEEILRSFSINKEIDLLFGQTKVYQPHRHTSERCFSAFKKATTKLPQLGDLHWREIGYSNNMAIKADVFEKIGLFKVWLGPGSIGQAAEDAEFILRSQIAGCTIDYNKRMIVYHNKWLKNEEVGRQQRIYAIGGIAAYAFFYFQGVSECKKGLVAQLNTSKKRIYREAKKIIKYYSKKHTLLLLKEILAVVKGLLIGIWFAYSISTTERENVVKKFYKKTK